jgi:hypothetical protein
MKLSRAKTGYKGQAGWTLSVALAIFIGANASAQQKSTFTVNGAVLIVNATTNAVLMAPAKAQDCPPALDAKRLFALGMIETGNDDGEIGAAGEVSRYQIHPMVWKAYSRRMDYRNTALAIEVARQHWAKLAAYFVEKAGRQPGDFDMYVLWNTKFGYYARRGFLPERLAAKVRDRAERFVNLVNRKG